MTIDAKQLRQQVIEHLESLNMKLDENGEIISSEMTKEAVKRLHAPATEAKLAEGHKWIKSKLPRMAISNYRIQNIADGKVSFSYRDYKDEGKEKILVRLLGHDPDACPLCSTGMMSRYELLPAHPRRQKWCLAVSQ